jgi:hypothetical protein
MQRYRTPVRKYTLCLCCTTYSREAGRGARVLYILFRGTRAEKPDTRACPSIAAYAAQHTPRSIRRAAYAAQHTPRSIAERHRPAPYDAQHTMNSLGRITYAEGRTMGAEGAVVIQPYIVGLPVTLWAARFKTVTQTVTPKAQHLSHFLYLVTVVTVLHLLICIYYRMDNPLCYISFRTHLLLCCQHTDTSRCNTVTFSISLTAHVT